MNIYIFNYTILELISGLIINWYWLVLPFIILPFYKKAWLWWRREIWEKEQKYMFLELTIPKEMMKPIAAMENVFTNIWPIYSTIEGYKKFKKKWWKGKKLQYICLEMVGSNANTKIYFRINRQHIDTTKVSLFSQYPEIEIKEVREDYAKEMSWNIPDKKYDMYGSDEELIKSDLYPIKTYNHFFEIHPENIKEEKRIDPFSTLLESLNQLTDKEKIWIQIRIMPVTPKDNDYAVRGKNLINKLVHRKEELKPSKIIKLLGGVADSVMPNQTTGVSKKEEKKELIPPEMKLTPREREVVEAIEKKIGKKIFEVNIRGLYFCNIKNFSSSRKHLTAEYFSSFSLPDQNEMKPRGETKTKIQHFFIKRRTYLRQRKLFRRYILRETPYYPRKGGTFILNTEELATIFHPPIELGKVGSTVTPASMRRGVSPTNLPT